MAEKNKLNLGCGKIVREDSINLDIIQLPGVNEIWNLNIFPYPFKDNTFETIYAYNIMEHLNNINKVMEELHRITKPNGTIKIEVPYYNSRKAFCDPTHKHFFTLDSFDYYQENAHHSYYANTKIRITKKELTPIGIGKIIPTFLLNYMAMMIGNIADTIKFELKVEKNG